MSMGIKEVISATKGIISARKGVPFQNAPSCVNTSQAMQLQILIDVEIDIPAKSNVKTSFATRLVSLTILCHMISISAVINDAFISACSVKGYACSQTIFITT